jgi:hypothetical protein
MMSWPADMAPPITPITRPRRPSNHRAATVAAVDMPTPPEPSAISTPAVMYTCQSAVTCELRIVPIPSRMTESMMTRRGPQWSASQPTKGPAAPRSSSETAAAPDSAARSQPKVASIGLMNTPKTARRPDASSMTTTRAPRTTHA